MNKMIPIMIGLVIVIAVAAFFIFRAPTSLSPVIPGPSASAETQAVNLVEQELNQAIGNINLQDIENQLLV